MNLCVTISCVGCAYEECEMGSEVASYPFIFFFESSSSVACIDVEDLFSGVM